MASDVLRNRGSVHCLTDQSTHSPIERYAAVSRNLVRQIVAALLLSVAAAIASGQSPGNPLEPPDRSSPRAALKTFLDSGDAVATFLVEGYLPSPSRAKFERLVELGAVPVGGLDVSALPPAAREKGSRAAAMALYEVLNRVELPPFDRRVQRVDATPSDLICR